ncbi:MAG: lipooligosaccharide transport system permease protein [Actinomycetota bacterium]|jgi:lipooligosaccharide transport system permease protein|nr:lipooligosaccharide transport system permease protein [Actinomycetota bacterium]
MIAIRPSARARHITERNARVYLRLWYMFVSGFFEPLFYLLSIGIGVGHLVGGVQVGGHLVKYGTFVAPGMMASAAMNGAVFDATFSIFFKLKYMKLYDSVVATPMSASDIAAGELLWSLIRGGSYSLAFLVSMTALGFTGSWWAVLALPAALLIGFAFSAAGMALSSFLRTWHQFDYINLALIPLFLFSGTFYPIAVYPRALQLVVQISPLYHGVALIRAACLGDLSVGLLGHAAYLLLVGAVGLVVTGRRLAHLLLT